MHPVQGYLEIVLNVGCPTYYYAVRNQEVLIKDRKMAYRAGRDKLGALVKEAGRKGIKIARGNKSSWNVRALVDEDSPRQGYSMKRIKSTTSF